jgi:dephospho-CoA kinase
MRELVFAQPEARRRLEAIVHPLVGQETARQTQAAQAAGHRCIVFDVPLLAESAHWRQRVNRVLVVDCTPQVQLARTMLRSGLTQTAVEGIMASQIRRSERLRVADLVIFNDTLSLSELAEEVRQIALRFGL